MQTDGSVLVTGGGPRQSVQFALGNEYADDENYPVNGVPVVASPLMATLDGNHESEMEGRVVPICEPSSPCTLRQSYESLAVWKRPHSVHEHLYTTHLGSSHSHPIPSVHPSEFPHNGFEDDTSRARASFPVPDSQSSSMPNARPLGPRGPLLSYAQLYGERREENTSSEGYSTGSRSTLPGDGAKLGHGHCRRQAIVADPFYAQGDHIEAAVTGEHGNGQGSHECVVQEDGTEFVDRCSAVTPPPPYEER